MNYKKTWFGWLNFAVGTLFMSVYIFTLLVSLFEFNGLTMYFFNSLWFKASFVASVASILVVVGILIIAHFVKQKISLDEDIWSRKIFGAAYVIVALLLLSVGVYLRYQAYISFDGSSVLNQTYYLKILNFFDGNTAGVTDILVLSYCYFYSFLFKVFGLMPGVLIVANIFFQILGSVCVASAFRHSFGKTVSIGALALLMLLPTSVNLSLIVSPDSYVYFIIAFIMYLFSLLLRDRNQGLMRSNANVSLFVLFGIVFGFLIYVNPVMILVPVFFVVRLLLLEGNDNQEDIAINRKVLPTAVISAVSIIVAVLGILVDAVFNGVAVPAAFVDYLGKLGLSGFFRIFYPDEYIIVCLVILAFCFCGYINFIFARKDFISALNLLFLCTFLVYAKNIISFDTSIYLIAMLGGLAGVGIKSLVFDGYGMKKEEADSEQEKLSENNEKEVSDDVTEHSMEDEATSSTEAVESSDASEITSVENSSEEIKSETEICSETNSENNIESEASSENTSETEILSESESEFEEEIVSETNDSSESVVSNDEPADTDLSSNDMSADVAENGDELMFINSGTEDLNNSEEDFVENNVQDMVQKEEIPFVPIENVLPIPKKHIKKELGYAFEPDEKYMKYDYEISDNDDFDIP